MAEPKVEEGSKEISSAELTDATAEVSKEIAEEENGDQRMESEEKVEGGEKQVEETELEKAVVVDATKIETVEEDKPAADDKVLVNKNEVKEKESEAKENESEVKENESEAKENESEAKENESEAKENESEVKENESEAKEKESEVKENESEVKEKESEVKEKESEVKESEVKENESEVKESEVKENESEVKEKESEIKENESEVKEKESEAKVESNELYNEEKKEEHIPELSDAQLTTTTSGEESKDKEAHQLSDSKPGSRTSSRAAEGERKTSSRKKEKRKKKKPSVPKLRRRSSSKLGTVAEEYIQSIIYPYMISQDHFSTGLLNIDVILQILYLPELNLQLTEEDLPIIQSLIDFDEQGLVDYASVASNAHKIITYVYSQKPDSQVNWVELQGIDGTKVMYNKKTGEVIDHAEDGMDLFEATIKDLFDSSDVEKKGYITGDSFIKMLQAKTELQQEHIDQLLQQLPNKEIITYEEFHPIGKEVVLKVYQIRDQSNSDWMHLNSPSVGGFYLNKLTGETRRELSEPNVQDATFIENAYTQINNLTFELEQERVKNKELENQVAQFNEHLEEAVAQLDETGRQLDNANFELQAKEEEIVQLNLVISDKEAAITHLSTRGAEASSLELELQRLQRELQEAHKSIQEREIKLGAQEQSIQDLSRTVDDITEELKNAHGVIDARDSNINALQYNLTNEEGKVKELIKKMPTLETKLSAIVSELSVTKKSLEEKTSQLHQAKKQLKQSKDKYTDVEKKMESLEQVKEKLQLSENENRTLKSFLTSKTAMVERRKKEIHELKEKLLDLESRDNRRAVILADVLEKTARSYQQELKASAQLKPLSDTRPFSAPNALLEELIAYQEDPLSLSYSGRSKPSHHTMHQSVTEPFATVAQKKSPRKKQHVKVHTVPKLPPIKHDFTFTTQIELKRSYKKSDATVTRHSPLDDRCSCEVCAAKKRSGTKKGPAYLSKLTGKTPLERIKTETEQKEKELAKQIKIGQRVLIQIKKSMYDLEPQKLTGIVKYIGKVDSEFVDDRIYVGVKLDDPVGNTDGLYKGKKYFDCPPSHGRMVRITSVIAVMPYKGIVYRPLQIGQESNGGEKHPSTLQTVS